MKVLDPHMYILLVMISNIGSVILLITAAKWPLFVRISFFLLFGWACGIIRLDRMGNINDNYK